MISLANIGAVASSSIDTPLGSAYWDTGDRLYIDARDSAYEDLFPGDTISAAITPRHSGSSARTLTPTGAVTVNTVGANGGRTFQLANGAGVPVAGSAASLAAHWLAPIMNGSDKTGTVMLRGRILTNGTKIPFGWGSSTETAKDFCEATTSSTNASLGARKTDDAVVAVTGASGVQLGFEDTDFAVVFNGTTVNYYALGAIAESGVADAFDVGNTIIDQHRIGASGRQNATLHPGLELQIYCATEEILNQTQIDEIRAAWLAADPPAFSGAALHAIGDSIMKGSQSSHLAGCRKTIYEYYTAQSLDVQWVGSYATGTIAHPRHSSVASTKINTHIGIATNELGTGNAFENVELVFVLSGTNNVNDSVGSGAAAVSEYATLLETIHTQIVSSRASARIAVATLPDHAGLTQDSGGPAATEVLAFNSGLTAASGVWDDFDTAHPSHKLFRGDLWTALGGTGSSSGVNFADGVHPSDAGYAIMANTYINSQTADGATLVAYLASIG